MNFSNQMLSFFISSPPFPLVTLPSSFSSLMILMFTMIKRVGLRRWLQAWIRRALKDCYKGSRSAGATSRKSPGNSWLTVFMVWSSDSTDENAAVGKTVFEAGGKPGRNCPGSRDVKFQEDTRWRIFCPQPGSWYARTRDPWWFLIPEGQLCGPARHLWAQEG